MAWRKEGPYGSKVISITDAMQLLCNVSERLKMKATFKHSVRATIVAGSSTALGGAMAGLPGIVVGGIIGVVWAWKTSKEFKSIPQIIEKLPPEEKQRLYQDVCAIIQNLDWTDVAQLTALFMSNSSLQAKLLGVLTSYITTKLKGKIQYGK